MVSAAFIAVLFGGFGAYLTYRDWLENPLAGTFILWPSAAFGIGRVIMLLACLRWRVRIHENGFVFDKGRSQTLVLWSEIDYLLGLEQTPQGWYAPFLAIQTPCGVITGLDARLFRQFHLLADAVKTRSYEKRLSTCQTTTPCFLR